MFSIIYHPIDKEKGTLKLCVDGVDILKYKINGVEKDYVGNVVAISDWLDENLKFILTEQPCPVETAGNSGIEKYNNCFCLPDEIIERRIAEIQQWGFQRDWIVARGGSFLAEVFFRKVDNFIEISWDNRTTYSKYGVVFNCPTGNVLIPQDIFITTIKDFLQNMRGSRANTGDGSSRTQGTVPRVLTKHPNKHQGAGS